MKITACIDGVCYATGEITNMVTNEQRDVLATDSISGNLSALLPTKLDSLDKFNLEVYAEHSGQGYFKAAWMEFAFGADAAIRCDDLGANNERAQAEECYPKLKFP